MVSFGDAALSVQDGWYCPDFGVRHWCQRLVASTGPEANWIGWVFCSADVEQAAGGLRVRLPDGADVDLPVR